MIEKDNDGSKIFVGLAGRDTLMSDGSFHWFKERYDRYKPDNISVGRISQHMSSLHIVIFAGTWCGDTHTLLPGFYKAMDAAGTRDDQITLYLVDRDKKTQDGATDKYGIINVPTFIVLKNGKELGRVVESVKITIEAEIAPMLADKN